jgi:hypothetical protein
MSETIVTSPMQWKSVRDISDVPPMSDADADCLREIRDVLSKYDCLDRFGISLIHKHFELGSDEYLLEEVDEPNRTLTVRPMHGSPSAGSIETQWQLRTGEALTLCHGYCDPPGGHRHYHQQRP